MSRPGFLLVPILWLRHCPEDDVCQVNADSILGEKSDGSNLYHTGLLHNPEDG